MLLRLFYVSMVISARFLFQVSGVGYVPFVAFKVDEVSVQISVPQFFCGLEAAARVLCF
jgi:hypothetical protein